MRERTEETRQKILIGARAVFIERGYSSATISNISERAGVTRRTIYGYFLTKREIFLEVIKGAASVTLGFVVMDHNVTTKDALYEKLYLIAQTLNDTFSSRDYTELVRIIISEVNTQPELSSIMTNGITRTSRSVLTTIFENAYKNKIIGEKDPKTMAELFVGGFVFRLYVDGFLEQAPGKPRQLTKPQLKKYVERFMPR